MKLFKSFSLVILAVVLGAILRLYQIDKVPMYGDELTMVLDSYSLLKNGTDQLGNPWPITFEMGAGRPAGYVYGSIPFVAIFGPTELGVRLLSVLSGLGLIILVFLLGKQLVSEKAGIWSALLMAISPWGINISRGGFEANLALFLTTLGVYLFLQVKSRPWFVVLSVICFGSTIHTYPTYKLTLPLLILILVWFQGGLSNLIRVLSIRYLVLSIILAAAFVIVAVMQTMGAGSEGRFGSINIWQNPDLQQKMAQQINEDRGTGQAIFHNKYLETGKLYLENYLRNFGSEFLLISGDGHPRHNMIQSGYLYLAEIITLILGFVYLLKEKKVLVLLLGWILIAPLATALVGEPHGLRSLMMLTPLVVISAAGLMQLSKFRIWFAIVLILIGLQLVLNLERLYLISPTTLGRFWSSDAKRAVELAVENQPNFDQVVLSTRVDNLEYAYPVYTNSDPTLKQFGKVVLLKVSDSQVQEFLNSLPGSYYYLGPPGDERFLAGSNLIYDANNLPSLVVKVKE